MTSDNKSNTSNAVIYLRVSTREQGDSKLGLEAQESLCRRTCQQLDMIVIDVFSEVSTGAKAPLDRVMFAKAHARAVETNASLVIAKLDRLSRNFKDTVLYIETIVQPALVIAENPHMTKLELRFRAIIAAEERELISKRTTAALAAKKARGYNFGREQARAKKEKALAANASSLMRAIELRRENLSLQSIVNILADEGYVNSKGNKWTVAALSHQLRQHCSLFTA